jgi:glyoxylase-like metal-dependent hydrolase (beta-lactamase superfamily II)
VHQPEKDMPRTLTLIVLFCLSSLCHALDTDATVPMKAVRVGQHSYYIEGQAGQASSENQGFMSNAGFVVTPDGVVVFDALGTVPLAQKMLGLVRKITPKPVKRVIVSHYHADHFYGLQVFKDAGAEIWAHKNARGLTRTEQARERFEQRKQELFPWVDENTRFIEPDIYLEGDTDFVLGGVHFGIRHVGPAHSAEDLAMFVREDGVLYAGDLVFKGRVPFVGDADSRAWLATLDRLTAMKPRVLVPGHGSVSHAPARDLALTRDYLTYLRSEIGKAVAELEPFEEAYARIDWSRFSKLPAFEAANRPNAYNTYLLMERELLAR